MQVESKGKPVCAEPIERIVLTGFMGAGKSTVGALLAKNLDWRFSDSDQEIVASEGASVAALFSLHGEFGFRLLEADAIARLLTQSHTVIALGGGALEDEATRVRIFEDPATYSVFLETPLDVALARCEQSSEAVRPLLQDSFQLAERFARRAQQYRTAHWSLSTVDRTPTELVLLIRAALPRLAPFA